MREAGRAEDDRMPVAEPGDGARAEVSAVIPFTERGALLDRAIASVNRALAAAPSVRGEVLPIDDEARRGVSWARNEGLRRARGEWVVFVDADDELGENFFAEIFAPYKDDPAVEMIVCGFEVVDGGAERDFPPRERPRSAVYPSAPAEQISGFGFIEQHLLRQDAHVWAKAFRRSVIPGDGSGAAEGGAEAALTFDESLTIGEDMLFLLDFALRMGKRRGVAVTEAAGYRYYENPAGAMKKAYTPAYLDELRCWKMAEERLRETAQAFTPYAFSALGVARVRTALMVPLKIARLPADEWEREEIRGALAQTADAVRDALKTNGVFAGLPAKEKIKTLLFLAFPRKFLRLAKRK